MVEVLGSSLGPKHLTASRPNLLPSDTTCQVLHPLQREDTHLLLHLSRVENPAGTSLETRTSAANSLARVRSGSMRRRKRNSSMTLMRGLGDRRALQFLLLPLPLRLRLEVWHPKLDQGQTVSASFWHVL